MSEDKQENTRTFPGEKEVDGIQVVRTEGRDFRVEGNDVDGFIGVSPEYRTYANETDKPIITADEEQMLLDHGLLTDVEAETIRHHGDAIRELVAKQEADESEDEKSDDDDETDDKKNDEKNDEKSTEDKPAAEKALQAPVTPVSAAVPSTVAPKATKAAASTRSATDK